MVNDTPRETRVLSAVVSLVDRLLDDFDVVDLLTDLTERCVDLLGSNGVRTRVVRTSNAYHFFDFGAPNKTISSKSETRPRTPNQASLPLNEPDAGLEKAIARWGKAFLGAS